MATYDARHFNPAAPLALVSLRNQSSGVIVRDVRMLIDSGADISLVPQTALHSLNLTLDPGATCELMAFDGRKSVAQVVWLELIFLRRTFRGRYLVSDQECGVLGRDVLNHVSLLLDGPRLNWEEVRPTSTPSSA